MKVVQDEELSKISIDQLGLLERQLDINAYMNRTVESIDGVPIIQYQNLTKQQSYVKIAEDHMTAWLYLEDTGYIYERSDIIKILAENGVVHGIDYDMVIAIVRKRIYEEEIEIAHGTRAGKGEDGYYEYFWNTELNAKPKILENGNVDYISMSELPNVKKGQMIAKYHKAVSGEPGKGVDGYLFQTSEMKELPKLRGSGYYVGDNKDEYYANLDGKIHFENGIIEIRPIHIVNGDATLIVGRIEFNGDVEIKGSVGAGVVIKATKNIFVEGTVNAAYLIAGGNIIVKKGITGDYKTKVVAKGDLFSSFIEYSEVHVSGNVTANTFLNSHVYADGCVSCKGIRSSIIGGYVHGLRGVQAKSVGNGAEVRTIVHAGYENDTYERYNLLMQKEQTARELMRTMNIRILEYQKKIMFGGIPKYKETELKNQIGELQEKKEEYERIYHKILEEKDALHTLIENGKGSRITVYENAFANSVVCLDKTQWKLDHSLSSRQFYYQNGAIQTKLI